MRKSVRNCRNLNMQTIRLRKNRPGSLAVSLALVITMLIVYLLSLQSVPKEDAQAASAVRSMARLRMEPMDFAFQLSSLHNDETQARVAAALCAENGGAGIVLREDDEYAVIHQAGIDLSDGPVIHRSAGGLTLEIEAPAAVVSAMDGALAALRAAAEETGALASSLEKGESDSGTVSALLGVYQTQTQNALESLADRDHPAITLIRNALAKNLDRIGLAMEKSDPGRLRTLNAGACLEWVDLAKALSALSA